MEVVFLHDASPGQAVAVRSASGEWSAVWRGHGRAREGEACLVELGIDEVESWIGAVGIGEFSGVKTLDGAVVVCGEVSTAYDDGVIALSLNPGTVLIESDLAPAVGTGRHLCLRPTSIEIFPTGV
ncbi:hypothetical protein [Nocardia sp. NPDC059228]|uniref:hypothetical protein n=1 Tax=Nocardia sp. NPDC059228 TaxID=3346777 RepID=UPI0036C8D4B0